jgi:hypothetical protein
MTSDGLRSLGDTGANVLARALRAESAASLARIGMQIDTLLQALAAARVGGAHEAITGARYRAADAVWRYFVQREALGLADHRAVIEAFNIPEDVLAVVGAAPPSAALPAMPDASGG